MSPLINKAPKIPYRIVRKDLPGGALLIKGRVFGMGSGVILAMLVGAITLLLLSGHSLVYSGICFVLIFALPFISRFRILISPAVVKVSVTYLGIPERYIAVPLEKVIVGDDWFSVMNSERNEDYKKNESNYLRFDYVDDYNSDERYVTISYNGKEDGLIVASAFLGASFHRR